MASRTLHSNVVSFLDLTDSRRLDVYINSNNPLVQIYNPNTQIYTPNWTSNPVILSASAYIDGTPISDTATFQWSVQNSDGTESAINDATQPTYTIGSNALVNLNYITYVCSVQYQGLESRAQITFSKLSTGKDSSGIAIKGEATSVALINNTSFYSIPNLPNTVELGDAWMYHGDLYVCVDIQNGIKYFSNVGHIQGPAGEDACNIMLHADATAFKIDNSGSATPSTITVTAQTINTIITEWSYSTDGGKTYLSTPPNGVSRSGSRVIIYGSTMSFESLSIRASNGVYFDTISVYRVYDGDRGEPGEGAPIAFLTNGCVNLVANMQGQVQASATVFNIVAYVGQTKVTPTIGEIANLPEGMHIDSGDIVVVNNELSLTLSVDAMATLGSESSACGVIDIPILYPVSTILQLSWNKTNATSYASIPQFCAGTVNILPTDINTPTSMHIEFNTVFSRVPHMTACVETSSPGVQVSVSNITTTGATIWITSGSIQTTTIQWIAIG